MILIDELYQEPSQWSSALIQEQLFETITPCLVWVKIVHNVRISLSFRHTEIKKKSLKYCVCPRIQWVIQERALTQSSEACGETHCTLQRCGCWPYWSKLRDTELRYLSSEFGLKNTAVGVFFGFNLSYLSSVRQLINFTVGISSWISILNYGFSVSQLCVWSNAMKRRHPAKHWLSFHSIKKKCKTLT